MENIEDEMMRIGDKTQQEVHLSNLVNCIKESKDKGKNDLALVRQLKMKLNYYIIRYGSEPSGLSRLISDYEILQN